MLEQDVPVLIEHPNVCFSLLGLRPPGSRLVCSSRRSLPVFHPSLLHLRITDLLHEVSAAHGENEYKCCYINTQKGYPQDKIPVPFLHLRKGGQRNGETPVG
jgi:hypothetical protein